MTFRHRRDLPRSARRLQSIASALTGYTAFLVVLVSASRWSWRRTSPR